MHFLVVGTHILKHKFDVHLHLLESRKKARVICQCMYMWQCLQFISSGPDSGLLCFWCPLQAEQLQQR